MEQNKNGKIVIYQVLPRLFGNLNPSPVKHGSFKENGAGKFSAFSKKALSRIKELGITHIWYTGIIEHATLTDFSACGIPRNHSAIVKGTAGSPYAIRDYYDVDPSTADSVPDRMKEFEDLIERTHRAGMKVIIDFVPNHVSRQYHSDAKPPFVNDLGQHDDTAKAFDRDNNFYYMPGHILELHFGAEQEDFEYNEFPAKATGNNCFSPTPGINDWYETAKLNYGIDYVHGGTCVHAGIPDTWKKMKDILLFWAGKGIDAFRCDMAEMVPVAFWAWVIPQVKRDFDVLFIAEIYTPEAYPDYIHTGCFDYLYDKVGLYDTLRAVMEGKAPAHRITFCWQALNGLQPFMLNFLENHDEQRIASDFFAGDPRPGIPAMLVGAAMATNPVMIYCGQETGERGMDEEGFSGLDGRTTIFDYWSMTSIRQWINNMKFDGGGLSHDRKGLRETYGKILRMVSSEAALREGMFHDLMYANMHNPRFNPDRQYAFLRKHENEAILIVANFDKAEQTVCVNIPPEAFEACEIEDNRAATVVDLFTGETTVGTLTDAWPYRLTIPGFSGRAIKFVY
ncbi:MAG: alpha-amylase [Tannerellaceae bacterium]|jgi:glycosidase|nr:alpha-amylase [Tannerellaceae bacterium]